MKRTKIITGYSLLNIEEQLNKFYDEIAEKEKEEIKVYSIDDVKIDSYQDVTSFEDERGKMHYGKPVARFYAVVNYTIY
ncbi:MAG: hypothetical protein Q3988_01075 [Gemella sp.]|nr:hypothetical protein [Gemella sp.]